MRLTVVYSMKLYNYFFPEVADQLGKQDVSQTWLILKLLYCGGNSDCSRLGLIQTNVHVPPRYSAGSRLSTTQVCVCIDFVLGCFSLMYLFAIICTAVKIDCNSCLNYESSANLHVCSQRDYSILKTALLFHHLPTASFNPPRRRQ